MLNTRFDSGKRKVFQFPMFVYPVPEQSQEQALSALVKTRCVLDDFEPALHMLAGDQGSPESIETWTLQQVRNPAYLRDFPSV